MDRNKFTNIIDECIKKYHIKIDWLLDLIEQGYEDECYKLFYANNEVFIIDLDQISIINWYKITHIGRCLTLVGFSSCISTMEEQIIVMIDDICQICAERKDEENATNIQ